MRIIGGEAKGRRLRAPATAGTRPATDRVREAVFSSIGPWVVDAKVADLYAGSGSFGLEALSRGAASAVFVENGRKALAALKANIEAVGLGGTVVAGTVRDFIARSDERFHLIFLDPPWDQPAPEMSRDLGALDSLLHVDAEIVVSRRRGDDLPDVPKTWRVATDKRYGDTRILRYEKTEDQAPQPP